MGTQNKIALGGGCHWCTEAVFQSLIGVDKVKQGFVASIGENNSFSEAIMVTFNSEKISLQTLIEIHLHTHKSTSDHSMREKYRSAVYTFSEIQTWEAKTIIEGLQGQFEEKIFTKVFPFANFKPSREQLVNYYYNDPEKPFCEIYIKPRLQLLKKKFSKQSDHHKLQYSE